MRLADNAFSVKIAVWKNHEKTFSGNQYINQAVVVSCLKVSGRGGDDNTELATTNASQVWKPPPELEETLKARIGAVEKLTSLSVQYDGTAVDYASIDGEPIHMSTLASLVMPGVFASVTEKRKQPKESRLNAFRS